MEKAANNEAALFSFAFIYVIQRLTTKARFLLLFRP